MTQQTTTKIINTRLQNSRKSLDAKFKHDLLHAPYDGAMYQRMINGRFVTTDFPITYLDEFNALGNIDKNKHLIRTFLRHKFAYAIPTKDAILEIVNHSPIIEMGAGGGYWASLVTLAGGEITCFDRTLEPEKNFYRIQCGKHYPVSQGDHRVLDTRTEKTLFLCWPPGCTPMAMQCLKRFRGDTVIFVGELGKDSCTGSQSFFKMLATGWMLVKEINIPSWGGCWDKFYVFKRV